MSRPASPAKLQLWKERLERFAVSQQTIQQFCDAIGCSVATYYYWQRKLTTAVSAPTASAEPTSAFVPVVLRSSSARPITVQLKDGTRVVVPADAWQALKFVLEHAQRVAS